ncbi:MAG: MFS transporter, partial [Acidimicrobiales bacterium]
WRSIFYVNLPIGVTALLAAWRHLGESTAPNPKRLDLKGAIAVALGLGLLVYPLTEGRGAGWPVWIWAMLGASLILLAAFAVYEVRRSRSNRSPLIHMSLFSDRAFVSGSALSMVFFMGLAPFFFTFSIFVQIGLGYSALHTGLTVLPFAIGSGLASVASDHLAKKLGNTLLSIGCAVIVAGMIGLMATVHYAGRGVTTWQLVPSLFVSGLGLGLFIAPVTTIILAGIRSEAAGSASGVISTVQQVGGSIGIAIIGVVFFGLLSINAAHTARQVNPRLEQSVAAASPQLAANHSALDQSVALFDRCFVERSRSSDPQFVPKGCPTLSPGASPAVAQSAAGAPASPPKPVVAAFSGAATRAIGLNFSKSFQETLFYEIAVYLVAFGLVFFLPRVAPPDTHV